MYQHDLPEGDLEKKLQDAVVDQVAMVGADINSCSLEILRNIPGLTKGKLAETIIKSRPFTSREDLKKVKGVGPKIFEQCAGFVLLRRDEAINELDTTKCHPEKYPLVRSIFKTMGCSLNTFNGERLKEEMTANPMFAELIAKEKFERVSQHLIDVEDPRFGWRGDSDAYEDIPALPLDLSSDLGALGKACPVPGIRGVVRNVADFGVFIDIGAKSSGLLHNSMMGPVGRNGLQVGSIIKVDIINACPETGRIQLARPENDRSMKKETISQSAFSSKLSKKKSEGRKTQ